MAPPQQGAEGAEQEEEAHRPRDRLGEVEAVAPGKDLHIVRGDQQREEHPPEHGHGPRRPRRPDVQRRRQRDPDQGPDEVRNRRPDVGGVLETGDTVRHGSRHAARGDDEQNPPRPRSTAPPACRCCSCSALPPPDAGSRHRQRGDVGDEQDHIDAVYEGPLHARGRDGEPPAVVLSLADPR